MKKIWLLGLAPILTSCGLGMPPEDSISGKAYEQCIAIVDLAEQMGGSQSSKEVNELRKRCNCQAKTSWKYEEEYGWSFVSRPDAQAELKKCES